MAVDGDAASFPDQASTMDSIKILHALSDFGRDKVFHLGVCLDVPTKKLEEFETMIQPECTWKKLSEALCKVGEQNLGRKIRDEHVLKQPQDPRNPYSWTFMGYKDYYPRLSLRECACDRKDVLGANAKPPEGNLTYFQPMLPPGIPRRENKYFEKILKQMKDKMKTNFLAVESEGDKKKFKVGYEARFGRVYWQLPAAHAAHKDGQVHIEDTSFFTKKENRTTRFIPRITCDLGQLLEKKCDHIPMNPEWQVDPLKFKVDGPLHEGITYIAVVTNLHADKPDGKFVLCDVYWRYDTKLGRPSRGVCFDIVLPEKKYDIRIADCCAPVLKADDKDVRAIADNLARSIHTEKQSSSSEETFSMILKGENFHVIFFRYKKLQQHKWKGHPEWILAEYDVKEFEMTKDKLKDLIPNKCTRVEFNNTESHKEIELWSQKVFPERYSLSYPRPEQYAIPQATGEVRIPGKPSQPPTDWTTEEILSDFDKFVQAAADIVDILEQCPSVTPPAACS